MKTKIYLKELAHMIVEVGKSEICKVSWQVEEKKELILQLKSEGSLEASSFFIG